MTITRGGLVLLLGSVFIGMFAVASFSMTIAVLLAVVLALAIFLLRHASNPDLAFAVIGLIIGAVLALLGIGTKVSDPVLALILLSLIV